MDAADLIDVASRLARPWDDVTINSRPDADVYSVKCGRCSFDVSGMELLQCSGESDLEYLVHSKLHEVGYE